ncbi:UNVERIFIED_CONTAM: hypothetical protein RKD43_007327 [Streptomyces graminofaciens]
MRQHRQARHRTTATIMATAAALTATVSATTTATAAPADRCSQAAPARADNRSYASWPVLAESHESGRVVR